MEASCWYVCSYFNKTSKYSDNSDINMESFEFKAILNHKDFKVLDKESAR